MDYWKEHAEIAMDEANLTANEHQINIIAGVIESAHEFYGQSMGHDVASANFIANEKRKLDNLKAELERERAKTLCQECKGSGELITYGGTFQSTSQCSSCNGEGRS